MKSLLLLVTLAFALQATPKDTLSSPLAWPEPARETRPAAYWWWLGSAVDRTNITRELQRYQQAGMGGVHIIPIYGAKGWEEKYIPYLSPQWLEMLKYTVSDGNRLGLNIDMTTGTGWCFGGPGVSDFEANALAVCKTFDLSNGAPLTQKFDPKLTQALVAFPSAPDAAAKPVDLTGNIRPDGTLDWTPPQGSWRLYAVTQRPSGQKVKRAAPGGAGHMLNLFHTPGVTNYIRTFEKAFSAYPGPWPRAMYHDSYEYRSDWAPDLFAQFERRRGYRLQSELPALFGKEENDRAARVKCDYRETISDIMAEESLPSWVAWCHSHAMLTRNQAHGSPGNLLDLYAAADIPETEMFHTDRNRLVSKFASSAAHVAGRPLVASETGTWLKEHFTETLADMKYLLDDLFLSGVNHVIYHGTCYSPDEVPWPGWLFYASYEMNPRNSLWRDVPALNTYATRCQSILQLGSHDNDLLLYWPIHDRWHNPKGMVQNFSVHARDWLEGQPVGKAAELLWNRGYSFDYLSDRQILTAEAAGPNIKVPGGQYRAIVIPRCEHIPLLTLRKLLSLSLDGATIVFEDQLPKDVPGWNELERRRIDLQQFLGSIELKNSTNKTKFARCGNGRIFVGPLEPCLSQAGVLRETMVDQPGLMFIRRNFNSGTHYFIANRGDARFNGYVHLAKPARSLAMLDPMTGQSGHGPVDREDTPQQKGAAKVRLQLEPGESIILRCFTNIAQLTLQTMPRSAKWWRPTPFESELTGTWKVEFIEGGPKFPAPFETKRLASWAELGGEEARRFAGTARYTLTFDSPADRNLRNCYLDLGKVSQSARIRLNGVDLGTLFTPPFRLPLLDLKPKSNLLEVEVTGVSANRIRDLDLHKVPWKTFHDINFVNISYKPFDASTWPVTDCGLLGPVKLLGRTQLWENFQF